MKYLRIELKSDLCAGSGESSGNSIDQDLCTDEYGIPYIPAKRIKGCLRQTAEYLAANGLDDELSSKINSLFGSPFGDEGNLLIDDARLPNYLSIRKAIEIVGRDKNKAYLHRFSQPENVERLFTAVRGQTKIENGLKVDGTLRFTRVLTKNNNVFNYSDNVIFYAPVSITNDDEKILSLLELSCKGTRHIGSKRNRGLGNVSISLEEKNNNFEITVDEAVPQSDDQICIKYYVALDSEIAISGCDELMTNIPARSIIGCLAGYSKATDMLSDEEFHDIFLNGMVKWSPMTPVINGEISTSLPFSIMKLKNGEGRLVNTLTEKDDYWKKLKPKNLYESYASLTEDSKGQKIYNVASVQTQAQYHHSISKTMLYTQDSIKEGYVYGGSITTPSRYYSTIVELLTKSKLRFGRSKNIQYANCHLIKIKWDKVQQVKRKIRENDIVFVIFDTDMVLCDNGTYLLDYDDIRNYIGMELFHKTSDTPQNQTDYMDMVRFCTWGGFQNMWNLQKKHIPAIKAGSIFSFTGINEEVLQKTQIGSLQNEGFGKCTIITSDELDSFKKIIRTSVDQYIEIYDSAEEISNIEYALTKQCVKELLIRYGNSYSKKNDNVPLGRLRLMLETSTDYNDFLKKIDTMKESDISSESKGKKKETKQFVKEFYGEGELDWERLLLGEAKLVDVMLKNRELLGEIEKDLWKIPLMQVIHNYHYEKEAGR